MDLPTLIPLLAPALAGGVVAAVVSLLVTHPLNRNLKALEGRQQRQGEAFRLAHSPRVTAAIKLWAAFCEFERATAAAVNPGFIAYEPATGTRAEKDAATKAQHLAHVVATQQRLDAAWDALKAALDEAECLIDEATFQKFHEVFALVSSAYSAVWAARVADDHTMLAKATLGAMATLDNVKIQRSEVVAAMRRAIAGESES